MRRNLLLLVTAGCISGCGTILNFSPRLEGYKLLNGYHEGIPTRAVFGGVARDLQFGGKSFRDSMRGDLHSVPAAVVHLADLPFSALADTVTLPLTIPATLERAPEPIEESVP